MMKKLYIAIAGLFLLTANTANSQCAYNNAYYETKAAPTVLGDSIITYLYGGEFSTITGMVAGNVYQVTTCGDTDFDSQITIYDAGGANLQAFNDDYVVCSPQSRIYFSPFTTGSYDVLIDKYNCVDEWGNFMTVIVKLWDTPDPIVQIPTVVHVVWNTGAENISNAQVIAQLNVLEEDFRRLNSDVFVAPSRFRGFSKDARIEFCLAVRDPAGNPTTGITNTYTTNTDFAVGGSNPIMFTSLGGVDAWPTDEYLNIWVGDLAGGTLGYTYRPGTAPSYWEEGIAADYLAFDGTITTSSGRTAAHEVGHWFDLYHVWKQAGCGFSDLVNDTPEQDDPTSGCPSTPTSCSNGGFGGDIWPSHMDYSSHTCRVMFTYYQYRRMEAAVYGYRSPLLTSLGCTAGSPPTANFTANTTSGLAPLTVNFTDLSSNSPTSWNWSFPGAATTSSTLENPTGITYNSAGTYTVTLTSTNGWGSDGETKTNYITVTAVGIDENSIAGSLNVYPNPNSGQFTIEFNATNATDISLKVLNVLGQSVYVENLSTVHGKYQKLIDLNRLSKGIYTLELTSSEGKTNREVIIE